MPIAVNDKPDVALRTVPEAHDDDDDDDDDAMGTPTDFSRETEALPGPSQKWRSRAKKLMNVTTNLRSFEKEIKSLQTGTNTELSAMNITKSHRLRYIDAGLFRRVVRRQVCVASSYAVCSSLCATHSSPDRSPPHLYASFPAGLTDTAAGFAWLAR